MCVSHNEKLIQYAEKHDDTSLRNKMIQKTSISSKEEMFALEKTKKR